MKFFYVLVSHNPSNIILELNKAKGNHRIIVEEVLDRVKKEGFTSVDSNNDYLINILIAKKMPTFVCITDKMDPNLPSRFLSELEGKFSSKKNFNLEKFEKDAEELLVKYNRLDSIDKVEKEIDKMNEIALTNISKPKK